MTPSNDLFTPTLLQSYSYTPKLNNQLTQFEKYKFRKEKYYFHEKYQ